MAPAADDAVMDDFMWRVQTKAAKLKHGCVGVEDPSEGGGGGFMSPEQRKVEELSKDVGYQRPESERLYLGSGLNWTDSWGEASPPELAQRVQLLQELVRLTQTQLFSFSGCSTRNICC